MLGVFWRAIRDKKWSLVTYFSIGAVMLWIYLVTYPSVQATQAQVSDFVKSLPPGLNKAFGLDARSFTTFEGLVSGKYYSLMWPILGISLLSSWAANLIAGEVEKGTIELILAQPISRTKIFLSKFLSGVTVNFFFVIFSILSVFPIANAYNISFSSEAFLLLAAVGFVFGLAIFGLSMLTSSMFSDKGKSVFLVVGVFLSMYVANIIALLEPKLESLKYLSFFHYFNYNGILLDHKVGNATWWIFLAVFAVAGGLGMIWFNRRDIMT